MQHLSPFRKRTSGENSANSLENYSTSPENYWLNPRAMGNGACRSATFNQVLTMYSNQCNASQEIFCLSEKVELRNITSKLDDLPWHEGVSQSFCPKQQKLTLVDEVEIINVNPNNANVRHLNGREVTASLRDFAPCLSEENQKDNFDAVDTEIDADIEAPDDARNNETREEIVSASPLITQSARSNKGIPPLRYGIHDSSA